MKIKKCSEAHQRITGVKLTTDLILGSISGFWCQSMSTIHPDHLVVTLVRQINVEFHSNSNKRCA